MYTFHTPYPAMPLLPPPAKALLLLLLLAITPLVVFSQNGCPPPAGIKIKQVLSSEISLSWDASNISANSKLQVAWAVYPTSNYIYKVFDTGETGKITGLNPATRYTVRMSRLCGTETQSALISLGTIRTLSEAEEAAVCPPGSETDLCKTLEGITTGMRGANYITLQFPQPPTQWLADYPNHLVTIRYALLTAGAVTGPWQEMPVPYNTIVNHEVTLNGLTPNTLYKIEIVWQVKDAAGQEVKKCTIPLNNTPTMGDDYIGPVFATLLPPLTLDCSAPKPLQLTNPIVTGGCSVPKITYTDQESGSGCNLQITRTWMAVDDCGRTSAIAQVISFTDTEPPTFVDLPANNATIFCGENLPNETPTAVDNCSSVTLNLSDEVESNLLDCEKTITRTWVASDACGNTASYQQVIQVKVKVDESNGEDENVPPLSVDCGQTYTSTPNSGTLPLAAASQSDIFWISGFPVLITDITGGNGIFSGKGKARLPFGNKVVYVEFANANVNNNKQVTGGTMLGVPDPGFVMPTSTVVNFGGDICVPPPPALVNGFNSSGEYSVQPPYPSWQPGDPVDPTHDPNGFDANGYHIQTHTQFNAQGCNQQGMDADGNMCNPGTQGPYYWLHNSTNQNPTTPEGIAYATQLQAANPNIRALVQAAIAQLITANEATLNNQKSICNGIRTELVALVDTSKRRYFFGENDIFFKEDMNLNFSSKPLALQLNVPDRSPQITTIETKHIDLYYCDKSVYLLKQTALYLQEFSTSGGLDLIVPKVLDALQYLTAAQVAEFSASPTKLTEWIKTLVGDEVFLKLQEQGLVVNDLLRAQPEYLQPLNNQRFAEEITPSMPHHTGGYLASGGDPDSDNMRLLLAQSLEMRPEELRFEYDQGFEYVGGIHRAFYLDAIVKARDRKAGLVVVGEDPESLLPIRLERDVAGRTYTMLLDKIKITPDGGTLDAFFILEIPNSNTTQKIVFRALNVPFTPGGVGAGNTKLSLQSDIGIRLNNTAKLIIKGAANETFVQWDCNGFNGMGLKADIEFCREFLIPLLPNLEENLVDTARVRAHFSTTMPAWGEMIATLTMDKFALAKHPDYKWEVEEASLDFSDIANPPGFTDISSNYYSEFGAGSAFSPQWKGFYMKKLKVTLPKKFFKENTPPVSIAAEKLIIDDRGLTGMVNVKAQLVSLDQGNLSGWAFSMDTFTLAVVANRIQGGGFGGLLHVPIFKSENSTSTTIQPEDCFRYTAAVISTSGGELYEFTVSPSTSLKKMDILVGKAMLDQSSFVKVKYADNKFDILANLTGKVTVNGNIGDNTTFKLPEMRFQDILLSNKEPYFRGGTFGIPLTAGANVGGFGIVITAPTIGTGGIPTQSSFNVGAAIKLVGDNPADSTNRLNFGAGTIVRIKGEMEVIDGRQNWKFKDYNIEKIAINASFKGVDALKGEIEWYKDHPVFGKGFRGKVSIKISGIKGVGGLGMEALAQFGKKDDYKYFFVDALATMTPGIELGGIQLRGFGGGVYYHMDRDSNAFTGIGSTPPVFTPMGSPLGMSLSGIKYFPNKTLGLGIKATIMISTTKEDVFNGAATFEIRFNAPNEDGDGGGIRDIALYGAARMMAKMDLSGAGLYGISPSSNAPIAASFAISYVFPTKTLHGELVVAANIQNSFYGAGPNYTVGKAVLHFDPQKWYINLGTPAQPLGIVVGIGGADLLTIQAYLCIGTGIPPMPPLPPYVQQLTGFENILANESQRATGRGFAVGANIAISTGSLDYLIFYGQVDLGGGFDLMMQQYDSITCSNNDNKPLGSNGWYASGQAWAYLDAEIGIKYKSRHFPILHLGVATALQMKLPNPFYIRGKMSGQYSILGGMAHGFCVFKFEKGKQCDLDAGDDIALAKLIEDLTPGENTENVEVNNKPVAFFGVPVNGQFSQYDNEGNEQKYYPILTKIELRKTDGTLVPLATPNAGAGSSNYTRTYQLPDFLESHTTYEFTVAVDLRKDNSGGTLVKSETKTVTFTTGAAPTVIPPSNVRSSYPLNGMYNFYKDEVATRKGYIELRDGQPQLLSGQTLEVRFSTKTDGMTFASVATALPGARMITFDLPANFANNQVYRMDLVIPQTDSGLGGGTVAGRPGTVSTGTGTANNPGTDATFSDPVSILYTAYFRTSAYNKFSDKLLYIKNNGTKTSINGDMFITATNTEPFDRLELYGTGNQPALLQIMKGESTDLNYFGAAYTDIEEHISYVAPAPTPLVYGILNGLDSLPQITIESYNANQPGVTNAVVALKNTYFTAARKDFRTFILMAKNVIRNECDYYAEGGELHNTCFNNSFPQPDSYQCCQADMMSFIRGSARLKVMYQAEGNLKPAANSEHPFFIGYRLPNGQMTTSGIATNFKHFSASY